MNHDQRLAKLEANTIRPKSERALIEVPYNGRGAPVPGDYPGPNCTLRILPSTATSGNQTN